MTASDWLWYSAIVGLVLVLLALGLLAGSAERAIKDLRYRVSELEWRIDEQHAQITRAQRQLGELEEPQQ